MRQIWMRRASSRVSSLAASADRAHLLDLDQGELASERACHIPSSSRYVETKCGRLSRVDNAIQLSFRLRNELRSMR